jgi:hypothetical protein
MAKLFLFCKTSAFLVVLTLAYDVLDNILYLLNILLFFIFISFKLLCESRNPFLV